MKSRRLAKPKTAKRASPAKVETAVPSPAKRIVPEQRMVKR